MVVKAYIINNMKFLSTFILFRRFGVSVPLRIVEGLGVVGKYSK
jgi:hypothetical protein